MFFSPPPPPPPPPPSPPPPRSPSEKPFALFCFRTPPNNPASPCFHSKPRGCHVEIFFIAYRGGKWRRDGRQNSIAFTVAWIGGEVLRDTDIRIKTFILLTHCAPMCTPKRPGNAKPSPITREKYLALCIERFSHFFRNAFFSSSVRTCKRYFNCQRFSK